MGREDKIHKVIEELKLKIQELLSLVDLKMGEMDEDEPLLNGPRGIDSIDLLEIATMVDQDYGVRISNTGDIKPFAILTSLRTLAEHIVSNTHL